MNTQNGSATDGTTLPSPIPTRQLFSAGAPAVGSRSNPTGTMATNRRSGGAIDNDCTTTINIATYNIRDGRNTNLEAALRACERMRIDIGILTETRLSTDRYTRSAYGYTVEAQKSHGPNVISCILVTGKRQHRIIGVYIPPGDTTTLAHISEASNRFPNQPTILMGDLNMDLQTTTPNARDTEIMAVLSTLGLDDMSNHFLQRKRFRSGNTWQMRRDGTILRSRCDYILGTDRRIFTYIAIKDPCYNSDHLMITGGILSAPKTEHKKYLRCRRKFPLRRQTTTSNVTETEYDKIKQHIEIHAPEINRATKTPWISDTTWKLIDARASKSKRQSFLPGERKRLSRRIKRAIHRDRKQRTTNTGNEIEQKLQAGNIKGVWNVLQRWYRHAGDPPPRPTQSDLRTTTNEYKSLYRAAIPPGEPITPHITPFTINDEVPTENEIATAIQQLANGKAPGHSGIRAEHLKALLRQGEREDATEEDRAGWEQICLTIQQIFSTGNIPEEMTWSILVLIPKSTGGTRGIGLLEVLWKVCSSIINRRLHDAITFHDAIHGFRSGRGTGTATIDAKLNMQLAHINSTPLYQIFLDLSKAYDTLDRPRTLQLLQNYGMGTKPLRLLTNFWNSTQVVARQQGYYGESFKSERGTTQGDIVSPTIFNVVVDAVVRSWQHTLESEGIADTIRPVFYADDGHLYSYNADALQRATNLIVDLFQRMGLKTNPNKTKAMICTPQPSITRIGTPAYKRRMGNHDDPTYKERKRQQVECDICHKHVQARSLLRHKRAIHGIDAPNLPQLTPPHLAMIGNTYEVSMPDYYHQHEQCPVPGCGASISRPIWDATSFCSQTLLRHNHYNRRRTLAAMRIMWNVLHRVITCRDTPRINSMSKRRTTKQTEIEKPTMHPSITTDFPDSRCTDRNRNRLPILGPNDYVTRQRLDSSSPELT